MALIDLAGVRGVEMRGTLVVADVESGLIRHVAAVLADESLVEHVLPALNPRHPGMRAGRPRVLHVVAAQRGTFASVARALGAGITVCDALPLVDGFADQAAEQLDGPAIEVDDAGAWREVGASLLAAAPWKAIDDGVLFELTSEHPVLAGRVGVVIGLAGQQRGVAFYRSALDYLAFRDEGLDALGPLEPGPGAVLITLDPLADAAPAARAWARARELCVAGHAVVPTVLDGGALRSIPDEEAPAWRAACEAVLGAWRAQGGLIARIPTATDVDTSAGHVLVRTREHDPDLLDDLPHKLQIEFPKGGSAPPRLLIRATRAIAWQVLARVSAMDGYSLSTDGSTVTVRAWSGDELLGTLWRLPDHREGWVGLRGAAIVAVAQGGTKRRDVRPSDVILQRPVRLRGDPLPAISPLFDPSWRARSDYRGPPTSWPKASTVLLDFLAPLGLETMPESAWHPAISLGIMIWNGVVLAEVRGDRSVLVELRRSAPPEAGALLAQLEARKRTDFVEDTRLLALRSLKRAGGQLNLELNWTPA